MTGRLADKIALVTGGTSGMALATAETFIAEGAHVYVTGRRKDVLDEAVERLGPRGRGIVADSSVMADLDRVFAAIEAEHGRLDVLFASAGTSKHAPLAEITPEDFDFIFTSNVRALLFTVQKAAALMVDGGSIIVNGSASTVTAVPGTSVYAGSKAAVTGFSRVWSVELAARNIRVNVMHPGLIETPMTARIAQPTLDSRVARIPLGRIGQPGDIASAVLFLASDDSAYITGTELFVTAGLEHNTLGE
jgi:NAD(P)-dependent dehydrogenase (short-subunit alcohol dehydrogenase family)